MLLDRYTESFDFFSGDKWIEWFNPVIADDVAFPPSTKYPLDLVEEMIESGITAWHHAGWHRDLWRLLEEWASKGMLIRVRLTATWLASTLPRSPLDDDIARKLQLLSCGSFCDVFGGMSCIYPAKPEYYRKTLQWNLAGMAEISQTLIPRAI